MATAVQKITLSSSRDIPFNKLVLSQSNVRRVKAGISIEELAEDIARRTLLQSLNVRPVLDAEGAETGMFEIPAGGRRYRALQLLVKQKRLAKTAPVPCVVRDPATGILGEDDSLAENVQREPLHPLDQFRAFLSQREKGRSEEEIAAAFFTSVNVVKQRLRLAAVSPALLDIYADDGMSLEQLMAFTVTADHARQEQVWQAISGSWQKEPYQIRRMLTEKTVRASDRRAVFVCIDAYEAAGGVVLRDLFQSDDGGWLEDVALLDRLVAEKLKAEAETIAAEGWKWIEVAIDFPYDHARGLRELDGVPADLSVEEQATIEALKAEYARLEAEHDGADELPDEVDQRLGEIETALAAFDEQPIAYQPADIARAGVFISIDAEGALSVDRGYVRPEDELPVAEPEQNSDGEPAAAALDGAEPSAPVVQRAVITIGGQVAESEEEDDDTVKPLPDRLLTELTAERTLALRDKLAITPSVAFQAVLYKFCLDVFSRYSSYATAMEVSVRSASFPVQAQGLKDTPAAKAIDARHKTWEERLPKDKADLWDWLISLTGDEQAALFAHCASFGVNALYEKGDRYGGGATPHTVEQRIADADRIARAVDLDMVESGWRPTVENYLGRVPKRRILEAVREGAGERAAQLIDHLKKGDMAKEAERLLAETGWLPEPLQMADVDQAATAHAAEPEGGGEALPEFLAGDDEETPVDQADESRMIAAE
ncbi:ParB/RepB/Spo0J family partition protein [Bradyrhizobium japonicum]|uniref:ParB/RepB/Spo0J family partition protein n=1 Tax=Bradyrhizobium japonicum TaxID=375 RepID=UPI001E5FAA32|nr:ParB/RepB/Spo0J family partition protein [Bradyrhizobium japonicum]MCD9824074.1 ParB N-terminal domain-containing protein [Bradyrhizobium japonicum]MCD9896628.1 ParB N-terminal domain-containing protein [Bradyrhizobium japonicum]WLB28638.1 ParB N-terminal domain-containing protein [Bradyrhizobium japonicum]